MKIALDGLPLGSVKTGVGHYTFEIARGLAVARPGDEFELVSHASFGSEINGQATKNLRLIKQPVNTLTKHWWLAGLPIYIRRNSIDLFHGTNYELPLWGGCPTVLTIHDLSLFLHPETHEQDRVKRARRRLPIMTRVAERIIVPTESVKREVCEHLRVNAEKVVVVREAARQSFYPEDPATGKPTLHRLGIKEPFILYVGAIEPRKNLLTLVKAFENVYKHTELQPQLVIAGPAAWLSDDLLTYIRKSMVEHQVVLTGYVTDDDLRALYNNCTLTCYPSLYEGAGLPPLEAMACGAPVITTDTSAISEMVGDAALLFPPTDYETLAKLIGELLMDDRQREILTHRGLQRSSEFSWSRTVEMTYQIYLDTMSSHKIDSKKY